MTTNKMISKPSVFLIIAVALACCSKKPDLITQPGQPGDPGHPKPDTSSYLQVSVTGIQATTDTLFALLSIESKAGQPVMTNKKVPLHTEQGALLTDKIGIAKGEYSLTKLLVTKMSDTALYAAPRSQTPKAPQVASPLAIPITITRPAVSISTAQVLPINELDAPENFGYTNDDFGYVSFIHLRTRISIRVGTVLYDSLPGKIAIDAINAAGNHWQKEVDAPRGINDISVPEKYTSFSFTVSKWNTVTKKTLNRQELQKNMIIEFSASRNPKRLAEEASFLETAAGSVPDRRVDYQYQANNLLASTSYFQKSTTVSGLVLSITDRFKYSGNVLDTIHRYDGNNKPIGYTAFFYTGGKISNIFNQTYDHNTGAAVSHDEHEASGQKTIEADYLLSNGSTMRYTMTYKDGNKVSTVVNTSTGSESVAWKYDDNINPYYQLEYHDLYFSWTSKNNHVHEQHNYQGSIPSVVPYKYEYRYDADGYPSELLVSYKGYTSDQHLYSIRTVYTYQ